MRRLRANKRHSPWTHPQQNSDAHGDWSLLLVLFVHGMGRSPLSAWPLLRRLRRAGCRTETFGYSCALEKFDAIVARLKQRLSVLAAAGDYVVIGHSLGGVLLRAALQQQPAGIPAPCHVFLLGSPLKNSRIATRLQRNLLFRVFAGDCGQLLASPARMQAIGALAVPATGVAGIRGIQGPLGPFCTEANDGVVAVSEVVAPWLTHQVQIPVVHTLLPSSALVARIVLNRLAEMGVAPRLHGPASS